MKHLPLKRCVKIVIHKYDGKGWSHLKLAKECELCLKFFVPEDSAHSVSEVSLLYQQGPARSYELELHIVDDDDDGDEGDHDDDNGNAGGDDYDDDYDDDNDGDD